VLANDSDGVGDVLTATLVSTVAHGTLTLNSNGSFSYIPAATYSGSDSFTYLPHGALVAGSPTSVTVTVAQGGAAAPVAPSPPVPAAALAPAPPALPGLHTFGFVSASFAPQLTVTADLILQTTPAAEILTPVTPSTAAGNLPLPVVSPVSAAFIPMALPNFIVPGDDISTLVLPASPEISHLPKAFAAAVHKFVARPPTIVTFVDPASGVAMDQGLSVASLRTQDQGWLLIDPTLGAGKGSQASRIRWDSHPS
jgi:hypothetical protein